MTSSSTYDKIDPLPESDGRTRRDYRDLRGKRRVPFFLTQDLLDTVIRQCSDENEEDRGKSVHKIYTEHLNFVRQQEKVRYKEIPGPHYKDLRWD